MSEAQSYRSSEHDPSVVQRLQLVSADKDDEGWQFESSLVLPYGEPWQAEPDENITRTVEFYNGNLYYDSTRYWFKTKVASQLINALMRSPSEGLTGSQLHKQFGIMSGEGQLYVASYYHQARQSTNHIEFEGVPLLMGEKKRAWRVWLNTLVKIVPVPEEPAYDKTVDAVAPKSDTSRRSRTAKQSMAKPLSQHNVDKDKGFMSTCTAANEELDYEDQVISYINGGPMPVFSDGERPPGLKKYVDIIVSVAKEEGLDKPGVIERTEKILVYLKGLKRPTHKKVYQL